MDACEMPKKVLILSNSIIGLHSFRKEVISAIRDSGYEVIISVPDGDAPHSSFFENIGCQIEKIAFDRRGTNPFADLVMLMKYYRLINKVRPDVVLTYTIKPNIYGGMAARICHVPQMANITGLGDAVENGGWLQKITVILYRIGLKKARKVFFQNADNRDFCLKARIVKSESELLPGSGVNLRHHTYQPYPEDDGRVRFLFIGRLLIDKGIREYFDAARAIKIKYPETEFQILGPIEGSVKRQLEELTQGGIIIHFGTTTDVRPFIGTVECTVMPSYHEGMSNVNLESAANGRPIITSNIPGCRETVEDSKTGYLIEARDTQSLIEVLERFIRLPYAEKVRMGKEGRRKMEREFDRQIIVNAYLQSIKHV